ncbi:MAG: cyclopropane-fatty-acyl-phospholipid synthase family protein [Pseudolabrys sp.]|nr:cyclopropane-fatty-acyl-phospholipid synthase family protein [Pseudolabrys sp.]
MSAIERAIPLFERLPLPDVLSRAAVSYLVGRTRKKLTNVPSDINRRFAAGMPNYPIAESVDDANAQHYEVPAAFFELVLGPRRKYSCCYYDDNTTTLAEAEELSLAQTAEHALLADGQQILELGCGWGSLSLWMASHYPAARITAVSNSQSQREYIMTQARLHGLVNLDVITADMNTFEPSQRFDRVVSVEMFEHMSNWRALLTRVRGWLKPQGLLFFHIFTHKSAPYRFEKGDKEDWIAQHFFTGGIMPSQDLIREFSDLFSVEHSWRLSGVHYERTANQWLENFDRNSDAVDAVLKQTYGADAALWRRRWRLFFLATAGLFGHANGEEWGVGHYRLRPVA